METPLISAERLRCKPTLDAQQNDKQTKTKRYRGKVTTIRIWTWGFAASFCKRRLPMAASHCLVFRRLGFPKNRRGPNQIGVSDSSR